MMRGILAALWAVTCDIMSPFRAWLAKCAEGALSGSQIAFKSFANCKIKIMKIVLGIILVVLIVAAFALYVLFVLNSRDLISCGDIAQSTGGQLSVTRVYTSDLNANATLSEIVSAMNENEEGTITAEQMTELLATYQNIIYAPVFTFTVTKEDTNTYIMSGSIYNGLNEDGEPTTPDFMYKNLGMTVGINQGYILAVQNVYDDDHDGFEDNDDYEAEFVEHKNVIDPVILANGYGAAFNFRDCDSFRIVFKGIDEVPSLTIVYTYDIVANNPLNFTSLKNAYLGVNIGIAYDDEGRLAPTVDVERKNTVTEDDE